MNSTFSECRLHNYLGQLLTFRLKNHQKLRKTMYFKTQNAGGNELWAKSFNFDKLDFRVSNCHKNTLFFDFWGLEMPDFKRSTQIQILRGCQSRNSIGSVWSTKTWKLQKTVKIRVLVINLMKTYLQIGSQKVEKLDFRDFLNTPVKSDSSIRFQCDH